MRRIATLALLLLPLAAFLPAAHAQAPMDLGLTYTQMRTKFVGGSSTDNFYMRGATVDYAYSPFHGIGMVVSLNGMAVTNLRTEIDIHQSSYLGGGRYTYSFGHISPTVWSRRASIFGEGLVGITHATAGLYPKGETLTSNATNFSYSLGGGVNYNLYHRFELRVMAHYFVTDLPNGGTNQQRDIQASLGVNWHFGN
jgi:opacity protein-like surface antigen